MTNILVPTDFTANSLQVVEQLIRVMGGNKVNVILFHAFQMPSPFDLLIGSRKKPYYDLLTDDFMRACKGLKDKYPQTISRINFRSMEGATSRLFKNFLKANEVDVIFYPDALAHQPVHPLSIDPRSFFKNCGVTLLRSIPTGTKELIVNTPKKYSHELAAQN